MYFDSFFSIANDRTLGCVIVYSFMKPKFFVMNVLCLYIGCYYIIP